MEISRFNPHAMADSQVRVLSTGRDRLISAVVEALTGGPGVRQQVLVTAPRGFGKSFFARAVQLAIADDERQARVTILPEEQRNVSTPSSLLREIARGLKGAPAGSVAGQFLDDFPGAWEEARTELEAALAAFDPNIVQIVVIENFDELVSQVFGDPSDQSKLRALLAESEQLALLATATSAHFDQDYEQRLFHAFAKFSLLPWTEDDHLLYFERRAVLEGREPAALDRGKIRALAQFTGGAPRMVVALANLLIEDDPLSAAALLDKLVDDLTPYYQALIDQMPPRTKTLFDALIRLSEPCSQSDLAVRVGTTQNRIAQHFAWLRERHLVVGKKRTGGRDYLYQVSDRLFVQYYRKRYLLHDSYSPLAGMAELLDGFFSAEENRRQALALFEDGRDDEGCEFIRAYVAAGGGDLGAWAGTTQNNDAIRALAASADNNHPLALAHFKKALTIARSEGDDTGTALILGQIGISAAKEGRYPVAIEAHREALTIWRNIGQPQTVAWILSQLAQDFRGALQYDDALHYSHLAIELWSQQDGSKDRVASLWGEIGENLRKMGRHTDAVDAYIRAQEIWQALDNDVGEAWVLGGIGLTRREIGRFRESIQSHRRAIKLLEKHRNKRFSVALNHSWIAASYRQLKEFRDALSHDEMALRLWREIDQPRQQIKTLSSMSVTFVCMEDFERAFDATREAFERSRTENFEGQIIWNAGQLAYLHVLAGDVAAIWPLLDERPAAHMGRLCEAVLTRCGAALSLVERQEGRQIAFERGRELLDGLQARHGLSPFEDSATFLLGGLLETASAVPLLQDLSDEATRETMGLSAPRRRAIELAATYFQAGGDESLIEQADPDIGDAVRAIVDAIAARKSRQSQMIRD
jgi:tetratricopeptide (TPR) repeat protein